MRHVLVDQAAQIIGASSATIRNWAKAGHIVPVSTHPLAFLEESVLNLKSEIGSGSFGRLRTRANKVESTNNFLPEEYAENSNLILRIARIVSSVKERGLEIEPIMFLAGKPH